MNRAVSTFLMQLLLAFIDWTFFMSPFHGITWRVECYHILSRPREQSHSSFPFTATAICMQSAVSRLWIWHDAPTAKVKLRIAMGQEKQQCCVLNSGCRMSLLHNPMLFGRKNSWMRCASQMVDNASKVGARCEKHKAVQSMRDAEGRSSNAYWATKNLVKDRGAECISMSLHFTWGWAHGVPIGSAVSNSSGRDGPQSLFHYSPENSRKFCKTATLTL